MSEIPVSKKEKQQIPDEQTGRQQSTNEQTAKQQIPDRGSTMSRMYLAPMEGITGYVYRNAHQETFGDIDRYFMPFLTNSGLSRKELHDILPANNAGMEVIPQILTNQSPVFLELAGILQSYGYEEVNLNLGCPSGTVAAKNRGSGFLRDPEGLERFLTEIFDKSPLRISVKTRIGFASETEWPGIRTLLGSFPFTEMIVHPRLREDFYRGEVRMGQFDMAAAEWEHTDRIDSLCYNGDIFSVEDYEHFRESHPRIRQIMMGRGVITNPGLPGEIRGKGRMTREKLAEFLDRLTDGYCREMAEERNVLARCLEVWSYLQYEFADSGQVFRHVRKCRTVQEYRSVVASALEEFE